MPPNTFHIIARYFFNLHFKNKGIIGIIQPAIKNKAKLIIQS